MIIRKGILGQGFFFKCLVGVKLEYVIMYRIETLKNAETKEIGMKRSRDR
jgi:choline kinase